MYSNFRITALEASAYAPLFDLSTEALQSKRIIRKVVDKFPGYPCRVSLEDAQIGEEVLLLSHAHHPVMTPYRASGPVYIRKGAQQARPGVNEIPEMLRHRLLSVRAYTSEGMMCAAQTTEGSGLRDVIGMIFQDPAAAYIHIHNASPGCYNCRADRV